ncbi:MAG: hypothetical protein J0M12_02405 [Deltaproteobacteria bacterium]|nr:hypothetical protein [Deltaproteobacteria bacterium]
MHEIIDTEPLLSLGLSATEVKIYLALLEFGPAKAGLLIKSTGVQNSVMHLTLGRLAAQGIVSYIRRGKMKVYQAAPPDFLLKLLDNRRQRLERLVPSLQSLQNKSQVPEAEIYEGMNGLKNMCFKLIEDTTPGDDFLFFGFACPNKEYEQAVYAFYREYTYMRVERGLKLRGIAHESMRKKFVENDWPHSNIRFVQFPTLNNMSICKNKVIIVPWEETQTSFLISSKSFADNCRDYFENVWKA